MSPKFHFSLLTTTLALTGLLPGQTQADSLAEALRSGQAGLDFRARYEGVDQDGLPEDADAFTLRSRLNYQTGTLSGFSAFVEFDDVTALGEDDYNDTRNGHTSFPIVADPEGTEVNQAYIQYSGFSDTQLRYGRQRIKLDNERYIGSVAWRQNEQTFDSFSIENKSLKDTTISYAYIDKVQRVFGPDSGTPPEEFEGGSQLFNLKYEGFAIGALTAYDYRLDFDNAAASSSNTYGLRFDGKTGIAQGLNLIYAIELASQSDAGDNPVDYKADYRLLELGLKSSEGYSATLGQEVLGSDGGKAGGAFQTPLATGHKFQGWADKFLNTPNTGIDDRYLSLGAALFGVNALASYHDYQADEGSLDYGTEWNASLVKKFGKTYELMLKYADYQADDFQTDTSKLWLQASAVF